MLLCTNLYFDNPLAQHYTPRVYSIYLHIPFCLHRCSYCDFNTYSGFLDLLPVYVQALCKEIEFFQTEVPLSVDTIYFGGGTPSLLSIHSFEHIFASIQKTFNLQSSLEISLEANPGTLTLDYLQALRSLGFNRLSLGMQSARVDELRLLGRQHQLEDTISASSWVRQAGFENLNLDLILGLPNQTLHDWQFSLDLALQLCPEHLSLYALSIEAGTPLQDSVERGILPVPDPDLAADMYEYAMDTLAAAGFVQYEISNWARGSEAKTKSPHFACRHNLQYWRNLPYLGFGAGAHSYTGSLRIANDSGLQAYTSRMQNLPDRWQHHKNPLEVSCSFPAAETLTPIDRATEMAETMMMGLRLTLEGVSRSVFQKRFAQDLVECYGATIDRLLDLGLLVWAGEAGDILRLTRRGRLLGNQVFMAFL